MIVTRQELEQREDKELAVYAMRSSRSRGRAYPADEHPTALLISGTATASSTQPPSAAFSIRPRYSSTMRAITTATGSLTPLRSRR